MSEIISFEDSSTSTSTEIEKRVMEAFLIFDIHGNKSVDVREVGTILRYLGCAPTEQEINEIISATELQDSSGTIHLSRFSPHVSQLLMERKMEPASPEKLLEAFRVLDVEGKGFLTKDYITKIMMEEGEPFTQLSIDAFLYLCINGFEMAEIELEGLNEIGKRITEAFILFDYQGSKSIFKSDIKHVLRFIGCAPTDKQIKEIISATRYEGDTIKLTSFLPYVRQKIIDQELKPAPREEIIKAFQVLDTKEMGYITKEEMIKIMLEEGEPMTKEELDEMLAIAVDPQTGTVPYEVYMNTLMFEPDDSIYLIGAEIAYQRQLALAQQRRISNMFAKFG